jgi:DNA-binding GntR family transcriptional regulator
LADDLRGRILRGELEAGAPLREEALASAVGLSRHTVRTALARLVAERLAIQEPYRGIRVTSFTTEDVRALQELRCALEAEAVRLTRERYGTSWPDELTAPYQQALQELVRVAGTSPDDWPRVAAAHAAVHRALVAMARSPRIEEAYARLDSEMLLLLVNLRPSHSAKVVADDHLTFLQEVQAEGESAVRHHLDHGALQFLPRSERGNVLDGSMDH